MRYETEAWVAPDNNKVIVTEVGNEIIVRGLGGHIMKKGIWDIFQTSRFPKYMFSHLAWESFKLYKFFALEVYYILDEIINDESGETLYFPRRTGREVLKQLLENTWLKNTVAPFKSRLNYKNLSTMKKTPFPYQKEFMDKYDEMTWRLGLKGWLANMAAGSGKTLTSLMLAECLGAEKVIIVSPLNAVQRVWVTTVKEEFVKPQKYWCAGDSTPPTGDTKYYIMNYEAMSKAMMWMKGLSKFKVMVILDECHNLNTLDTKRTNEFSDLCKITRSENIVYLSGTPVKSSNKEFIPMFRVIDPLFTKGVEANFTKAYLSGNPVAMRVMRHRLDSMSFRVEKKEMKLAPPEIYTEIVKVPDPDKYKLETVALEMKEYIIERRKYYAERRPSDKAFYDKCVYEAEKAAGSDVEAQDAHKTYTRYVAAIMKVNGYMTLIEELKYCNHYEKKVIVPLLEKIDADRFMDARTLIKYPALKIVGECLGLVLTRIRIECYVDMAKHIKYEKIYEMAEKKTVVFSSYISVCDVMCEKLVSDGFTPARVYGSYTKDRDATVGRFEVDPKIDPVVATYQSLSTAVPLVMADTMVIIDVPFRDYILQQAISRIHRVGATTQTKVVYLTIDTKGEPNLASRNLDIMSWAAKQVEIMTGVENPFDLKNSDELGGEGAVGEISNEMYSGHSGGGVTPGLVSEVKTSSSNIWGRW
jgi:superfamily II DNA or RNA helicase